MKRWHSILVVIAILVIGFAWIAFRNSSYNPTYSQKHLLVDEPRMGTGSGPIRVIAPPRTPEPIDSGSFTQAQARAFALLGEVLDGRREQLPTLDAETLAAVEPMRRLLATQPVRQGEGRPTIGPTGASAKINRDGAALPTSISPEPTSNKDAESTSRRLTEASGEAKLEFGHANGTVTSKGNSHTITGREAWAAIKAKPGQGMPLHIIDQGEGGHVIAVFGEDFGTVRVNGGLVVPGRYYLIKGTVDITGMAPVGVHIRPLSAVPSYQEQPLMAPSANG